LPLIVLTSALAAADTPAQSAQPAKTYRNPIIGHIGPADPHVILHEGRYYLYPTWDGKGYDVFVSDDLVTWRQKPKCYTDPRGGAWAPDVFHNKKGDGKFYLYYTVNNPAGGKLIGVAVADHPLGPFTDKGSLVENNAIDAHLFQDDDDSLFLYYVLIGNPFRIFVRPMSDPLTLTGEPTEVIRPTEPWETARGAVTEGPWMLKHKGLYYLMYSGSGANGPEYAIGYATASSPTGPFTKHPGNPIAKQGDGVFGPGHHCVVEGPDSRLWMVYHQQNSTRVGWSRFLAIDPLWFDENGVIHTRTTRNADQPAPLTPTRLTVLSYNIYHGEDAQGGSNLDAVAAIINELKPDLVALQEVDNKTTRSKGLDLTAELSERTAMEGRFGKAMDYAGGGYGVATLSRLPIIHEKNHPLPHTAGVEPRTALELKVRLPDGRHILFINTHLDHQRNPKYRTAQADRLLQICSEYSLPIILAGDLNTTPDTDLIATFTKDWSDTADNNPQPTFPAVNPNRKIDYILARPKGRWKTIESRVIEETVASDHRPILATLQLEPDNP